MSFPLIFEGGADYVTPPADADLPYVPVTAFVPHCAYLADTLALDPDGQLVQADTDVDPKAEYDPADWTPISDTDAGLIPITPQEIS